MARLTRPADLDSLLAIHAEQHYIQVITRAGQELVLYRLSDAVSQLPDVLGIQVHRSWWVSRQAIESVRTSGRKMHIRLCNGLEVPVSAPYQALARRIAADNAR
jgi:DNA-binding LytR/AlgR family response regulator